MEEPSFKSSFKERLLRELLGKYERSAAFLAGGDRPTAGNGKRPQLTMQAGPFVRDYEDEMDYRKKEWMNETLLELERSGIIAIAWQRYREGQDAAKVYLDVEALSRAYSMAGMTPKHEKTERLLRIMEPLRTHPWVWVQDWAETVTTALTERKSGGLDLDDPEGVADLVHVLGILSKLDADVPKRMFSLEAFGDTKHFEQKVEARLLALLRQHSGADVERDEELLGSVGVIENPAFVYVCGPLRIMVNDRETGIGALPGGAAISQETARRMTRLDVADASRIVMIENLTSYHQWVARYADREDLLTVYTGGFPSRTAQQFLSKLSAAADSAGIPVFHWGDMDIGGIRIFEFLRKQYFPRLEPLYMDEDTCFHHKDRGIPLSPAYAAKVAALLKDESYEKWSGLLRLMERYQIRIEQENVSLK